ncbi:MAG: cytochrome-c peroxidase, partial [Proteobacteria bacterium]|nr:cytochrome-c peroxidase [Pseudomonadota bacterium]
MRAQRFEGLLRGLGLAALIGGAAAFASPLSWAAEFGPVPAIEVDAKKAELGKRLFFDKRLSGDAAISCATCHVPDKGFGDGL